MANFLNPEDEFTLSYDNFLELQVLAAVLELQVLAADAIRKTAEWIVNAVEGENMSASMDEDEDKFEYIETQIQLSLHKYAEANDAIHKAKKFPSTVEREENIHLNRGSAVIIKMDNQIKYMIDLFLKR